MQRSWLRRLLWVGLGLWSFAGSVAAQAPLAPQPRVAANDDRTSGEERAPPRSRPDATRRPEWLEQERVGPPYEASGRWYVPTAEPGYEQTGTASWYGADFHGQRTASGEMFDQDALTAAHPTLPIPSLVQITNLENGREAIVRVNDRGPFAGQRLIDVSRRTADVLGFASAGHARVHVRYLGPAPRHVAMDGTTAPVAVRLPAVVSQRAGEPAALLGSPQADRDSGATPTQTRGAFFVQVGAYANLDNAHRARDAVGAAGPVTVDIRETPRGQLFRVRLGPWRSRQEADAARRAVASLGYGDAVVAAR